MSDHDTRRGFLRRALVVTLTGPAEVQAAMVAMTAPAASDWAIIPHPASAELIEWMADRALALAARERQGFFVEYANEAWNLR